MIAVTGFQQTNFLLTLISITKLSNCAIVLVMMYAALKLLCVVVIKG